MGTSEDSEQADGWRGTKREADAWLIENAFDHSSESLNKLLRECVRRGHAQGVRESVAVLQRRPHRRGVALLGRVRSLLGAPADLTLFGPSDEPQVGDIVYLPVSDETRGGLATVSRYSEGAVQPMLEFEECPGWAISWSYLAPMQEELAKTYSGRWAAPD